MEALLRLDRELLLWLNGYHSPFLDLVMIFLTRWEFYIPAFLMLAYSIRRTCGRQAFVWAVGAAVTILLCEGVSSWILKPTFQRLRPTHDPALADMVHIVCRYAGGRFGFVSTHAANSFGLALYAALLFRNRLFAAAAFTAASLVVYTRLYLGVHFPTDVLAGMLLGLLLGLAVFRLTRRAAARWASPATPESPSPVPLSREQTWLMIGVFLVQLLTLCAVVRPIVIRFRLM